MPDASFMNDFIYQSHKVMKGYVPMDTLPTSYGKDEDCETLEITLTEISSKVTLELYYTVYENTNIITRRVVLKNEDEKDITLRRIMSMMVDIPNRNYKLVTFDGGWSKEAHRTITGFYQTQAKASESYDYLRILGLKKDKVYVITTKEQRLFVKRVGGLVKHILPIELDPNGFILRTVNKLFSLKDCVEYYEGYGDLFETGIVLNNQFMGSYYNTQTRLLGDFGSNLYVVKENKVKEI